MCRWKSAGVAAVVLTQMVSPAPLGSGDGLTSRLSSSSCGERAADTVTYTTWPAVSAFDSRIV